MRALAMLVGLAAACAASFGAFDLLRAIGPVNTALGSSGDLLQTSSFARAVDALKAKFGGDAGISNLSLDHGEASGTLVRAGRQRYFRVDGAYKVSSHETGKARLGAVLALSRIEPDAIDALLDAASKESGGTVERLSLQGSTRQWTITTDGEPDTLVANLDGGGVRLSGEPNPEPVAADADSLLRERNLAAVLNAAARESDGARLLAADVRPDRVTLGFVRSPTRVLSLTYGYDAQLTDRDIEAVTATGDAPSIALSRLDPGAIERMARTTRTALKTKGLRSVNYVLLDFTFNAGKPALNMYLADSTDPSYVSADLRGRGLTWPGRT